MDIDTIKPLNNLWYNLCIFVFIGRNIRAFLLTYYFYKWFSKIDGSDRKKLEELYPNVGIFVK